MKSRCMSVEQRNDTQREREKGIRAQRTYHDAKRAVSRGGNSASRIQTPITVIADDSHYKDTL